MEGKRQKNAIQPAPHNQNVCRGRGLWRLLLAKKCWTCASVFALVCLNVPPAELFAKSAVAFEAPPGVEFRTQVLAKDGFVYWLNTGDRLIARSRIRDTTTISQQNLKPDDTLWKGDPLVSPSGIAIGDDGEIYVADPGANAVFVKPRQEPLVAFIKGDPLRTPTGVAVIGKDLVVADAGAGAIFMLLSERREIFRLFDTTNESTPWKILASDYKLLAFDSKAKSLLLLAVNSSSIDEQLPPKNMYGDSGRWDVIPSDSSRGSPRGELLRLNTNLQPYLSANDFTISGGILYFLGPSTSNLKQAVTMYPLLGGSVAAIAAPESQNWKFSAISADSKRLYLSDGVHLVAMPIVVPATLSVDARLSSEVLVDLYNYLFNAGTLQVKHYELENGDSVAKLIQRNLVLPAGYATRFDSLFCRLNSRHCHRSRPDPYLQPGDSVDLPLVKLTEDATSRKTVTLPFTPDQYSDPRFVRHVGGTLGEFAGEFVLSGTPKALLRKQLKQLNNSYTGKDILKERAGTFVIPVVNLTVAFAVPKSDIEDKGSKFYTLRASGVSISSPAQFDSAALQATSLALPAPTPALAPRPEDPRCGRVPEKLWNRTLEIIHYCNPIVARGVGIVGVVDKHFDPTHPEFYDTPHSESALIPFESQSAPIERKTITTGGPNSVDWEWDHGTHLAAIIGARGSTKEMIGLEPRSQIYAIKVPEFSKAVDKEFGLHLYNISLAEDKDSRSADAFREIITKDGRQTILFVLAAGNRHQPVKDGSLAGLGSRENVLVVGASDESNPPKLWEHSDYDEHFVSIVAPGTNIRSAMYGGGYEFGSGTSQSTALVTGAATLLMSIEPNWAPWQWKERIISTSDIWIGPDAGSVFGGVLNVRAAVLDTRAATIWLHSNKKEPCIAQINYIGDSRILLLRQPGALPAQVHHWSLRRIKRHADNVSFTVLASKEENKNHSLVRYEVQGDDFDGVTDLKLSGGAGCGGRRKVPVTEIDDLYNGFY